MKICAKIKWLIDEPEYGIAIDKIEHVNVDADYVEADAEDIIDYIQYELLKKYNVSFFASDDDFIVANMDELIEEISSSDPDKQN